MVTKHTAGEILGTDYMKAAVAVVGCGGKTTFAESLARQYKDQKVLISPATKIMPVKSEDVTLCETMQQCIRHKPTKGIQCLGIKNNRTGKLEGLPVEFLKTIFPQYDLAVLEADGSAGLPCKGWAEYEPAVPRFCTHTAGIVTLNALGRPAGRSTVHRMGLFTQLTGICEGDIITIQGIADMICKPEGMFKNSAGRRFLFINQVETAKQMKGAQALAAHIRQQSLIAFEHIAYGSARQNSWSGLSEQ